MKQCAKAYCRKTETKRKKKEKLKGGVRVKSVRWLIRAREVLLHPSKSSERGIRPNSVWILFIYFYLKGRVRPRAEPGWSLTVPHRLQGTRSSFCVYTPEETPKIIMNILRKILIITQYKIAHHLIPQKKKKKQNHKFCKSIKIFSKKLQCVQYTICIFKTWKNIPFYKYVHSISPTSMWVTQKCLLSTIIL